MISEQSLNRPKRPGGDVGRDVGGEAAATLALRALAHVAGDPELGPRLLDVTGLEVATLRARAADPAVLAAVLAFLSAHEPSLLATARALGVAPAALIAAEERLS